MKKLIEKYRNKILIVSIALVSGLMLYLILSTNDSYAIDTNTSRDSILDSVTAADYLVYDVLNDEVIKSKKTTEKTADGDTFNYFDPASVTKVSNVIYAIKILEENNISLDDKIVLNECVDRIISENPNSSHAGFKTGDEVSYRTIMYGALFPSGLDAAYQLAMVLDDYITEDGEVISGSGCSGGKVQDYAKKMTTFVKSEVLKDENSKTNYTNAWGGRNENHITTLEDTAKILEYAMKNEDFRNIISSNSYTYQYINVNNYTCPNNADTCSDDKKEYTEEEKTLSRTDTMQAISELDNFVGGKGGTLNNPAVYNAAVYYEKTENSGEVHPYIIVTANDTSKNGVKNSQKYLNEWLFYEDDSSDNPDVPVTPTGEGSLYSLSNAEEICNSVANDKFKVFISSYYDDTSYEVAKNANGCGNKTFFDNNLANYSDTSYESFTRIGLFKDNFYTNPKLYLEGKEQDIEKNGKYNYFMIQNRYREFSNGKLKDSLHTLKAGEKIYFEVDASDNGNGIDISNYNDLRVSIDYSITSDDINIGTGNAISYYVIGDNGVAYGPYSLYEDKIIDRFYIRQTSSGGLIKLTKHQIISDNILTKVPNGVKISKIRVIPYNNYPLFGGSFKIHSFSLNSYPNGYTTAYNTVNVANASNTIRHNVVNNMVERATIKWDVAPSSTGNPSLYFYHHYRTGDPLEYLSTSSKVFYGIPYLNRVEATMEDFVSHTIHNKITDNAYFSYTFPKTYLSDTTAFNGTEIIKGSPIGSELYVYETNSDVDGAYSSDDSGEDDDNNPSDEERRSYNLQHDPYVLNGVNTPYFVGMDCSSSIANAEEQELPYVNGMGGASLYFSSNQIEVLGGISSNLGDIDNYLRGHDYIDNNTTMTIGGAFKDYYNVYFRNNYSEQQFYNAYGLTLPGDVFSWEGHSRLVTGYTHVVCGDGTSTDNYTDGYCNNHNGINGTQSYAVLTELTNQSGSWRTVNYDIDTNNSWELTFNNDYTDVRTLNDFINKGNNENTSFNINRKYTFSQLYGTSTKLYLPFRYKMFDIVDQNKVVVPTINVNYKSTTDQIEEDKYLKGVIIGNYVINGVKYEINGDTYYDYPSQRNVYSLYYDIPENIKNVISDINYGNGYSIKVSVKEGPVDIASVNSASNADSEGYIELLNLEKVVISSIKVTTNPTKTTYIKDSEDLDLTGGILTVTYSNGTTSTVSLTNDDVKVTGFNKSNTGKQRLNVSYKNVTTSLEVEVVKDAAKSIKVTTNPIKTVYVKDSENLDLTGGVLTVTHQSGKTSTVPLTSESVSTTGFDNTSLGNKTITVNYDNLKTTFTVEVIENSITGIKVTTTPTKIKYLLNEEDLDLTGGILTVTYLDGKTYDVPLTNKNVSVSGFDNKSLGTKTITVKYNNFESSFDIEVIKVNDTSDDNIKVNPKTGILKIASIFILLIVNVVLIVYYRKIND